MMGSSSMMRRLARCSLIATADSSLKHSVLSQALYTNPITEIVVVANLAQLNIPWQDLSEDALYGVIEEFVTREGTEYGASEISLSDKCLQVKQQLERGEALITFDETTQTCSIVPVP